MLDATYVILALGLAIVGGYAVYAFIERPVLLLLRRGPGAFKLKRPCKSAAWTTFLSPK